MPIRMIAKELYKLQQEVEELEVQIESTPMPEREALQERLIYVLVLPMML